MHSQKSPTHAHLAEQIERHAFNERLLLLHKRDCALVCLIHKCTYLGKELSVCVCVCS